MAADKTPRAAEAAPEATDETAAIWEWPADYPIIASHDLTMIALPGNDVASVQCALCGFPLGGDRFTLKTIIESGPCVSGNTHIPSVTAAVHVSCDRVPDAVMADRIAWLTRECSPLNRG
jgi:hypothetical protein